MSIPFKWLRDLCSILFSIYYIIYANEADEKVRPTSSTSIQANCDAKNHSFEDLGLSPPSRCSVQHGRKRQTLMYVLFLRHVATRLSLYCRCSWSHASQPSPSAARSSCLDLNHLHINDPSLLTSFSHFRRNSSRELPISSSTFLAEALYP
jgi:hypothetical protein